VRDVEPVEDKISRTVKMCSVPSWWWQAVAAVTVFGIRFHFLHSVPVIQQQIKGL
jgi:hypothetical protein